MTRYGAFLAFGLGCGALGLTGGCSDADPVFTPAEPLPAHVDTPTSPRAEDAPDDDVPLAPMMPPADMRPPTDIDNPDSDESDPDEPEAPPPEEPEAPPFVVSVSPVNGAKGVESDATLVITFSEPMDEAATESAYLSEDLPSTDVSFEWSADSTVLTITPLEGLPLATGVDPEAVTALDFTYVVSDRARDREGDALLARAFSFSTAREITQTFAAVQNRDLTGNFRGNGAYGSGDCARNQTTVCIGDSATPADFQFMGFMSFDLRSLPSDLTRISMAELSLEVTDSLGNAFNSLGDMLAEHVAFDVIGTDAFDISAIASLGVVSTGANNGQSIVIDVSDAVASDRVAGRMSQFRFRFEEATDDDGNADVILSDWTTQQIRVVFLLQ